MSIDASYGIQPHTWPLVPIERILRGEGCTTVMTDIACRQPLTFQVKSRIKVEIKYSGNSTKNSLSLCNIHKTHIKHTLNSISYFCHEYKYQHNVGIFYTSAHRVNACQVSFDSELLFSLSLRTPQTAIVFIDWAQKERIWWDQRHSARSQSKRRVRRFLWRDIRVHTMSAKAVDHARVCSSDTSRCKNRNNTVLSMRGHVWRVRGGTIDSWQLTLRGQHE